MSRFLSTRVNATIAMTRRIPTMATITTTPSSPESLPSAPSAPAPVSQLLLLGERGSLIGSPGGPKRQHSGTSMLDRIPALCGGGFRAERSHREDASSYVTATQPSFDSHVAWHAASVTARRDANEGSAPSTVHSPWPCWVHSMDGAAQPSRVKNPPWLRQRATGNPLYPGAHRTKQGGATSATAPM